MDSSRLAHKSEMSRAGVPGLGSGGVGMGGGFGSGACPAAVGPTRSSVVLNELFGFACCFVHAFLRLPCRLVDGSFAL
jgi:hypothetical protein